jgi:hypothetical protein
LALAADGPEDATPADWEQFFQDGEPGPYPGYEEPVYEEPPPPAAPEPDDFWDEYNDWDLLTQIEFWVYFLISDND